MENCETTVDRNYIENLREEFQELSFNRLSKSNGLYVTNSLNLDTSNDSRIFRETQIKRILRGPSILPVARRTKQRLSYFSQSEDRDPSKIYMLDSMHNLEPGEMYAIQNVGHATQLIQLHGFNILTDPVFGNLNGMLYPSLTKSHPNIEKFIQIDIILISHNHRDHLDISSLKKLMQLHLRNQWRLPQIFAPVGDRKKLEGIDFKEIETVDWYTKISVKKTFNHIEKQVSFLSFPADHRSGRYGFDHHKSLVTGWIICSQTNDVIFKYSGDTRSLTRENQKATDAILWYEIKSKNSNKEFDLDCAEIPIIICFEPSGPNYTRSDMDVTHQSTSYSALLRFTEAENLSELSGISSLKFVQKIKTFMIHHNKFELGPDRFNEGLFIFKKLIQYLCVNQDLDEELERQKSKLKQNLDSQKLKSVFPLTFRPVIAFLPAQTSLLVHAKDFIIKELQEVTLQDIDKNQMKECLIHNTLFLKIGQRITHKEIETAKIDIKKILKYKKNTIL